MDFLRTFNLPTSIDDLPPMLPNPREIAWESSCGRLWIQTDNQQVEQIFAGRSCLESDYFRPLGTRIARYLFNLLEKGWRPIADISDLVLWDARNFNTTADHAANCALDLGQPWERSNRENIELSIEVKANIRLCFDGARRGGGQASAGIAIFAYLPRGGTILLYRAGCIFGSLSSAFLSEMMALEWCLSRITDIMEVMK